VEECCATGQSWPLPTALILDQFGANVILPQLREIVSPSCKTLMYWCCSAACLWGFLVPSELGGVSDFEDVIQRIFKDEKLGKGRSEKEILEAVSTNCCLKYIKIMIHAGYGSEKRFGFIQWQDN